MDTELAVGYFQRAMRLSPLDPEIGWMLAGIAISHNQSKRFAQALPYTQRALEAPTTGAEKGPFNAGNPIQGHIVTRSTSSIVISSPVQS